MVDEDDRSLAVLIGGRRAGVVTMGAAGRFSLTYDEAWREAETATPLSLSMPLAQREHSDAPVRAFLWGLLPDSERVLDRWAQDYQVSPRNPFALLRHVGEDCAGAAQFVRPERVDRLMAGEGNVQWLTDTDVAERLRILRRDPTAWHVRNSGQFSLAGAQAKIALHHDPSAGRWGEPRGSVPTTHILKPAVTGLDDHDLNEHLCLTAARLLGLPAASTHVGQFGDERAIVVQRYDRRQMADGTITRIHQEDMCQALGVPPTTKYQNEGGPTPEQVIELLRRSVIPARLAATAVNRFVDALAFNWIIYGTDGHAKNYSLLLSGSQVRLAPLLSIYGACLIEIFCAVGVTPFPAAGKARMTPYASTVVFDDAQRERLQGLTRSQTAPYREVVRARIVLAAADGMSNAGIARWPTNRQSSSVVRQSPMPGRRRVGPVRRLGLVASPRSDKRLCTWQSLVSERTRHG